MEENERSKHESDDVLVSDDEMSVLLHDGAGGDGLGVVGESDRGRRVVPYNFRRPDRLSKEQVRSLYMMHDMLAKTLSSSLPLFLRTGCEVDLISVEQQSFGDYLRGMPDPTTIFRVYADQLKGSFAMEMNPSVAFPVVDRMLGGDGGSSPEQRAASELEMKVLEAFMKMITDSYCEVWRPVVEFRTEITGNETSPQLFQMVAPNEVVATVVYQMQVGETNGSMSICLPVAMLEGVIEHFTQSSYSTTRSASPEETSSLLKKLAEVEFPVAAQIEKFPAAVADLMSLEPGDLIRSSHRLEQPVNILVGDAVRFKGRLAAMNGRVVLQTTEATMPETAAA